METINQRRKEFIKFLENRNADQLEKIFIIQETKAKENGKIASVYSGMALRKLLENKKFDYIRNEKIAKNVKKNAGSVLEYLIARDIKEIESHTVDNGQGVDIKGRWNYEIKAFTTNSAPHGYKNLQEWENVFSAESKQLLFSIDRTVYQMSGKKLLEILPLLKMKEEHKKEEIRIASTGRNFKILVSHAKELDTVALY